MPVVSRVSRSCEHLDEGKPVHREVLSTAELHDGARDAYTAGSRWGEDELSKEQLPDPCSTEPSEGV